MTGESFINPFETYGMKTPREISIVLGEAKDTEAKATSTKQNIFDLNIFENELSLPNTLLYTLRYTHTSHTAH